MRALRTGVLISVFVVGSGLWFAGAGQPAYSQDGAAGGSALDAAQGFATMLDGATAGVSGDTFILALEEAAEAGEPMAQWQLGLMYEMGEGVQQDRAKAFGYFSQIANDNADAAPRGVEADIVAQSFVKVGEYYREGLPEAGIPADEEHSNRLILHAASYFGDADAQYRVGLSYMEEADGNGLQSARWLSLAARKGHAPAQAQLGRMLFNGEGIEVNQVEGLMWIVVAGRRAAGSPDETWIQQLLADAMSVATVEQRQQAVELADSLGTRFGGL